MRQEWKFLFGSCIAGVGLTGGISYILLQQGMGFSNLVMYSLFLMAGLIIIYRHMKWKEMVGSWKAFMLLSGFFIGGGLSNMLKTKEMVGGGPSLLESPFLYDMIIFSIGCVLMVLGYVVKNMVQIYSD